MKVRASGILLGVAMLAPVFQVFATDLGAAGRTWHVIKEDATEMVVVGRDQSGVGRFPSVLVATIHAAPKVSIEQIGIRYDYDVALVDLDCDTEGRHRYAEKYSYRLGQGTAVSSDTADSGWRGPTLSPFTGELIKVGEEWSIGCNAGSVGIPLRPAQNYDAMTLAYRQRLDDKRKAGLMDLEAERKAKWEPVVAKAAREIVPETSLAIARTSAHWHGGRLPSGIFLAWDSHGIKPGSRPGLKRMSHAIFHLITTPNWASATPNVPPMDFMVTDAEFDCAVPSKWRSLATARYAMFGGFARATHANRTPDGEWSTRGISAWFWEVACTGGTESNALPAKMSFDELLVRNRNGSLKSG